MLEFEKAAVLRDKIRELKS
ncbi:MAG: UvrB/UvrC motif-containing protein [Candidatus Aenigmarchaeota archaeon]|nr:UvrB/UvrC motif-containing protein [Candidatus Aenigmarchaeota archaeon]